MTVRKLKDGMWPGAATVPWKRDAMARAVVDAFPEGMSYEQIGLCMGVNRERVRQILEVALEKLRRKCRHERAELLAMMSSSHLEERVIHCAVPESGLGDIDKLARHICTLGGWKRGRFA